MNRPITLRTLLLTNGLTLLAVVAIVLSTPTFARTLAQITTATTPPATVPYQGTLTDASGTPINDSVAMTFKFYAAPTGGTALWTEQRTGSNAVPVTNGLFSVALGQVTPIPANVLAQPLWLGISVNGDAEMTPREQVQIPAMAATVPDGSITLEKIAPHIQTATMLWGGDNDRGVTTIKIYGYDVVFESGHTGYGRGLIKLPVDWKPGTDLRIGAIAQSDTPQTLRPYVYYSSLAHGDVYRIPGQDTPWDVRGTYMPEVSISSNVSDITITTIPAAKVAPGDLVVVAVRFPSNTGDIRVMSMYVEYEAGR